MWWLLVVTHALTAVANVVAAVSLQRSGSTGCAVTFGCCAVVWAALTMFWGLR